MASRIVHNRIGGGQAARDNNGVWWVRYYKNNKFSGWQPHRGKGKPAGTTAAGRLLNDTDIDWENRT